jgi:Holliday junction resolvasome RuvABC endonuclease subunit
VATTGPDVAIIEKVPESLRGGYITVVRLAAVHGVARLVLARRNVPYVYIPVPTLKKYATGGGRAEKQAMIDACHNVGAIPHDDNQADAAWLRMLGRHRYDGASPSVLHALALPSSKLNIVWPDLAARPHKTRSTRSG